MRIYCTILILFSLLNGITAQKNTGKKAKKESKEIHTLHGYRYVHFASGNGDLPQAGDKLLFDIVIKHKDSILEDSRRIREQPELEISDKADEAPNPVADGLRLCRVGDSIIVYERIDTVLNLPPEMAGWKEISYHIHLKSNESVTVRNQIRSREKEVAEIVASDLAIYKAKTYPKIIETQSGLAILVHTEGEGAGFKPGESAKVMYYGVTMADGKKFDSSYEHGTSFSIPYGAKRVIEGWEEALGILKRGSKATIFVPAVLGYGDYGLEGMIAPGADLVFYIEVLE